MIIRVIFIELLKEKREGGKIKESDYIMKENQLKLKAIRSDDRGEFIQKDLEESSYQFLINSCISPFTIFACFHLIS